MKCLLILMALCLMALTPIYNTHETKEQSDEEIRNLYLNVQPLQFIVTNSTPSSTEFQEGQIVLLSSDTVLNLMITVGTTVYYVPAFKVQGK